MWVFGVAVLAATAPLAGASCSNPLTTLDLVLTQRPSVYDFEQAYPPRTEDEGGRAVLLCSLAANGRLGRCRVSEEEPRARGFGEAALKLQRHFRFAPKAKDGRPVAGLCVRIPIVWSMD